MTHHPHIYTVGGTVQAGGGVYIPRPADDELLARCREGEFCYVLTARQMGKSSLMVRAAERLAEAGVCTVILDLTRLGASLSAEQWYLGLVDEIVDQLDLRVDYTDWWARHAHLGATQRLGQFLRRVALGEKDDLASEGSCSMNVAISGPLASPAVPSCPSRDKATSQHRSAVRFLEAISSRYCTAAPSGEAKRSTQSLG